jgi:hypothetical protein
MASDFVPDSAGNRYSWLVNLKQNVADNAATLGLDTAQLAGFNAISDPLIAVYKSVIDADLALRQASGDAQGLFSDKNAELRAFIERLKKNPGFTPGIGAAMKIFTTDNTPADADIKPTLIAEAERGHVRITGTKNYAETVNIYMRRNGGSWILIAPKRKRFPFLDETPLAQPAIPEQREYMARGVNGDEEIGQDSDIVTVTFAG